MTAGKRELVTGTVASATFLGLAFVAHFPLLVAGLVAGGVYLGSRLVIRERLPGFAPNTALKVEQLVRQGFEQAQVFSELASRISNPEIARRVNHISERLTKVFEELKKRPRNMGDAARFVCIHLPQAVKIIESYIRLSAQSDLSVADHESVAAAEHSINMIADALKSLYQKLFEQEVMELTVANATLQQILSIEHPTLDGYPLSDEEKERS